MSTKNTAQTAPRPDHLAYLLKMVILFLGLMVATTMLARYGFVNLTDWHHFIPPDASNNFVFTG